MKSIIIKDSFYDSPIVQGLRLSFSKMYEFAVSSEVNADLVFPFCGNMAFAIFYPDSLNKNGISKVKSISQVYDEFVIIVCISFDDAHLYKNFLYSIPTRVTAVVCFPHENFSKAAASFIYDTITEFKQKTRDIEKILKTQKNYDAKPSLQEYMSKIRRNDQ